VRIPQTKNNEIILKTVAEKKRFEISYENDLIIPLSYWVVISNYLLYLQKKLLVGF